MHLDALQHAIQSGDQNHIMRSAHKLNGLVANCGGVRLLEAGRKIEYAACDDQFDAQIINLSFLKKELEYLIHALEETDWKAACNTANA